MPTYPKLTTEAKLEIINRARSVLRGQSMSSAQLKALYQDLEHMDQFAYATEVLLVKMKQDEEAGAPTTLKEYQTLAKYIYKDHQLPSSFKFERALQGLKAHDDLAKTTRCETLGLAGAIYKRRWQFDHQFKNLILSRYYYKKGFDYWKEYLGCGTTAAHDPDKNDDGYTAINFAYISELMAVDQLEEQGSITGISEEIAQRFRDASDTRRFILQQFIKDPDAKVPELKDVTYASWVIATVAEAYFGLGVYDAALRFIQRYVEKEELHPWQIRTFQQQLFSIAYLQSFQYTFYQEHQHTALGKKLENLMPSVDLEHINRCLAAFEMTADKSAEQNQYGFIKKDGKLGLALSGGGFRASLFHIGVLAALAERDELRNVEVLSCVSGGSIIGAYYYLKLKILLENKSDQEITRQDYIEIVQDIEVDFLSGVQQNLRMRLFMNLESNFRMLFGKYYSRTHRLGELYEEFLYRPLIKRAEQSRSGYRILPEENKGDIYMHNLYIQPKDAPEGFTPLTDNWKRSNKIPQLVLNATSINTGHNWQFTASWMGEPPGNIQADVDVKPRLRRMYYAEAPDPYKKFKLGYAVGASSCVPVMFHPMPMRDLYPGIDLQLVDGGLHDNQGIAALIEQECTNMFISDASGQLPTNTASTGNEVSLFFRSDNILQERLRELQFLDIKERNYSTQVNRLYKVHLKSCLQQAPVSWKHCTDPARRILYGHLNNNNDLAPYGILRSIQRLLSEIRTDLDAFHDTEAYALMYSGYLQTHYEYGQQRKNSTTSSETLWQFSGIRQYLTVPAEAEKISPLLVTSKKIPGKVLDVNPTLRYVVYGAGILLALALLTLMIFNWNENITFNWSVKGIAFFGLVFLVGWYSKPSAALINYRGTIRKYITLAVLSITGFIASIIYVQFINRFYLEAGRRRERPVYKQPHQNMVVPPVKKLEEEPVVENKIH